MAKDVPISHVLCYGKEHLIVIVVIGPPQCRRKPLCCQQSYGYTSRERAVLSSHTCMQEKNKKITIGVFGYGNMGRAIAERIRTLSAFRAKDAIAVYSHDISGVRTVKTVSSAEELFAASRVVFLCIKPQDFYKLAPFKDSDTKHLVVISIMAGVRTENIRKIFPGAKIVRTMPNLPIQIGEGVIGWYFTKTEFSSEEYALLEKLFSVFGLSVLLRDERMLDALTAVAGSGPAYVFLFANALIRSAQSLGFDRETAERIVSQTMQGSLAYAATQKESDFSQLIQKVQSKGGTTEAALKTLDSERFYAEWEQAIKEARRRAEEISSYEPT